MSFTLVPGTSTDRPGRRLRPREWLGADDRSLRRDAMEVALGHGVGVAPDTVTVVLAARAWCVEFPAGVWTAELVRQLLWLDVATWCAEFDVDVPADVAPALWAVVTAASERGAPGSEPLACLIEPIVDSGDFRPPRRRRTQRRAG